MQLEAPFNIASKRNKTESSDRKEEKEPQAQPHLITALYATTNNDRKQILLTTASILLRDAEGKAIRCRALPAGDSMSNYITHELVQKLNLNLQRIKIPISGLSDVQINTNTKIEADI